MKQITLSLPFAWLTIRFEIASPAARHRSVFPVRQAPIDTTITALRQRLSDRLLVDMAIDRSRSD